MRACCHFKSTLGQEVKGPDISEVAQRSGVPASALRYYEEKGLITSTGGAVSWGCSTRTCSSACR
ncbi:MerR family DNA-binding transcriptional regulator [Sphingomonas sp. Root241]|uniref:MerR family DNA-binding transcriptional regulator n=1 Tax=Sphingomonas sp. Root241 TaxID=1736501 RepID=UPI001F35A316|nr:MerR family DNA-binding transcriptional regulator [Sphingomonas sp. Root241]